MKLADVLGGGLKVLQPKGGCDTCPRGRKDFVPSTHNPNADLLIIGEAPGAQEVEEREGFIGQSGQLLRRMLKEKGITEFSLSNVIHCRPPDNRNPHKKEISACLNQYLINDIKEGYSNILLVGKVPADTLFPDTTYRSLRGHVAWHPDFPGQRFYTIYHPAYILRRRDQMPVFERHIERLARIIQEDPFNPAWTLVRGDSSSSREKLAGILAKDSFAFDIETNGLESWHPDKEITAFALCASKKEAVFFHKNDPYFEEGLKLVGEALENPSKTVIAHNAGFDLEWLEQDLGILTRCRIADTQALYYLIYMGEDFRKARMRSLKDLTEEELDGYRYLVPSPHLCTDVPLLAKYGSEDVIRTYELFRRGFPQLNRKQMDLFFRISSPSSLALRRLQVNGLHIDTDYADDLADTLQTEIEQEIAAWEEEDPEYSRKEHKSGTDGFLRYMYKIKGWPVIQRTEKDNKPSQAKDTIKELIRDHGAGVLKHHLKITELEKQQSTFVKPYQSGDVLDPFTNRVHPSYFNCFTRTGRTSSRNPNAQNIPRDKKVRSLFAAPEGKIFMQSDLSQIELRIAMCLSGDETGIDAYLNEGDLHAKTAKQLAADAGREDWTKEDRTNAKIMNFSLIYGGDEGTVKRYAYSTFGINYSWSDAEKFHKTFFGTYDALHPWHQSVIDDLRTNRGYMETVMGHPRFLEGWDAPEKGKREHYERVAINTTCQSPAGYMTILILYLVQQNIKERGLDKEGVLTTGSVHDSILYELPPNKVIEVIGLIEEAVDEVKEWISSWFIVPLVMDYEVGESWGDLQEVDTNILLK